VAPTRIAKLEHYGLLQATGEDARAFLHAQLTNDVEHLAPGEARFAGWCSAKGRLLATFLVVPHAGGFLLQLARDLVPAVAKRLSMFILRSRVKLVDVSGHWAQYGVWSADDAEPFSVRDAGGVLSIRMAPDRALELAPVQAGTGYAPDTPADEWTLAEVRAGRPMIVQATQDQFVPQMVNLELAGGVDFRKGCYPGQEIVARAQYRGAVKRRMVLLRGGALQPGQELYSDDLPGQPSGVVVNAAGGESLAVLQTATVEAKAPVRAQPAEAALEVLPLAYGR
jgi:hypothetical protein